MSEDHFGQVEGLTLRKFVLVRRVYLQELFIIEMRQCAICYFDRDILWSGSYDRDKNVECFGVCELCGKELIEGSSAIIKSLKPETPSTKERE